MLDFIPSKYYKKFCEENGVEFTHRQLAAIAYNCPYVFFLIRESDDAPLFKRLERLETIASKTDDIELKDEIKGLTAFYNNKLERFKDNSDKSSVYLVENDCFFTSYEKALEYGMSDEFMGFMMAKLPFIDTASDKEQSKCDVLFNSHGDVLKFNIQYHDTNGFKCQIIDKGVPFKNPFERGDIVTECFSQRRGVVKTSQARWDKMISDPDFESTPFNRAGLEVEFITSYGDFEECAVPVLQLEKQEDFGKEDKDERCDDETKLLKCASNILREDSLEESGLCSFHDLFYLHDKMYRNYGGCNLRSFERMLDEKMNND